MTPVNKQPFANLAQKYLPGFPVIFISTEDTRQDIEAELSRIPLSPKEFETVLDQLMSNQEQEKDCSAYYYNYEAQFGSVIFDQKGFGKVASAFEEPSDPLTAELSFGEIFVIGHEFGHLAYPAFFNAPATLIRGERLPYASRS